jgi:hypothetical protein
MKCSFIIVILFFSCSFIYSQGFEFSEYVDLDTDTLVTAAVEQTITYDSPYTEIVIIAKDSGTTPVLPPWFNSVMNGLHTFFYNGTFGKFDYQNIVLKTSENEAFLFPETYDIPGTGCESIHKYSNMVDVIVQADAIYDFDTLDFDHDNIVPVHFCSIGPYDAGISGYCYSIITQDLGTGGQYIKGPIVQQTGGSAESSFRGIFYHESGHTFFIS